MPSRIHTRKQEEISECQVGWLAFVLSFFECRKANALWSFTFFHGLRDRSASGRESRRHFALGAVVTFRGSKYGNYWIY